MAVDRCSEVREIADSRAGEVSWRAPGRSRLKAAVGSSKLNAGLDLASGRELHCDQLRTSSESSRSACDSAESASTIASLSKASAKVSGGGQLKGRSVE